MPAYILTLHPSGEQLGRWQAASHEELRDKLLRADVEKLSIAVIEAMLWRIEQRPHEPANYGAFTLRSEP